MFSIELLMTQQANLAERERATAELLERVEVLSAKRR